MEQFRDGNMADVYRMGDLVRKQRGPWWGATRQVLDHLESRSYPWSPGVVAESDTTVDLTYVAGETLPASLAGSEGIALLHEVAQRTRALHDVLDGFQLAPGTECVPWPLAPDHDSIICHNDLSPWNIVVQDGTFRGFIDWDLVSYGTREWELAWMCWRWAPIYPVNGRSIFTVDQQVERCRILLQSYGLDSLDLRGFVDLIDRRMECALEVVEQLGAQGVAGFDRLLETGMHLSAHDDRAWLRQHWHAFQQGIESP